MDKQVKRSSHHMNNTRLHTIWKNMKQRCYNPKRNRYQWYGGKGIKVCDEWLSFAPFADWSLANGYTDDLVLDREDSDKDYCPENCQWVTVVENSRKATIERFGKVEGDVPVEYQGRTQKISEWAAECGIPYKNLYNRLLKNWTMQRATTQPIIHRK